VIYLDSNVFIYAALGGGKEGGWCRDLIRRIAEGEDESLTSALTVDEVVYQVRVSRGPEASIQAGEAVLQMAHLTIAPADAETLWKSLDLGRQLGLYPRDAIHAATALLRGTPELISEDADFDRVEGLRRRWMR
jgi:uncharacterized protein